MLIPIAQQFGIDLVNSDDCVEYDGGILTPPIGMALFMVARVGNMTVSTVIKVYCSADFVVVGMFSTDYYILCLTCVKVCL